MSDKFMVQVVCVADGGMSFPRFQIRTVGMFDSPLDAADLANRLVEFAHGGKSAKNGKKQPEFTAFPGNSEAKGGTE